MLAEEKLRWSLPSSSTAHLRDWRIMSLVTCSIHLVLGFQKALIFVLGVESDSSWIRLAIRAQMTTGSWRAWPFLCWVTVSYLLSFFGWWRWWKRWWRYSTSFCSWLCDFYRKMQLSWGSWSCFCVCRLFENTHTIDTQKNRLRWWYPLCVVRRCHRVVLSIGIQVPRVPQPFVVSPLDLRF